MKKLLVIASLSYLALVLFVSCNPKEGEFFHGALGLGEARVILSSSVAGNQVVSMYDQDGNFIKKLFDYTSISGTPRGLARYGAVSFIVAVDGLNQFDILSIDGSRALWSTNAQVTGNFYDIVRGPEDYYYAIETNSIEKYDSLGNRIPPTSPTPYINTTTGGCVLSTPTGMAINANGQLVVVSSASSNLSVYNLNSTATCASQVAFGNNPRALISHSNGYLYIVTTNNAQETLWRADSDGTNPVSLFANNITILQDGYAMAELPSGNILVSSAGTDSVVEFDPDGNFVRNFAKDSNTNDVFGIAVLGGN